MSTLGPIALLGSGETAPGVQKIHRKILSLVEKPVRSVVIETPAGFEPNSEDVARKIADYLNKRMPEFEPSIDLIPARKQGTDHSPDDPEIATPIFSANHVFMGPGSPTYAARQLADSYVWHAMQAAHRRGAAICFSSASTISISRHALPVYEIYKVGQDLHWQNGLDFFGSFGLSLVVIPHWNNRDGGDTLDTSRCYMGEDRFQQMLAILPDDSTVLGIDENTALLMDPIEKRAVILGQGGIVIRRAGVQTRLENGENFSLDQLGPWRLPDPISDGLPEEVWQRSQEGLEESDERTPSPVVRNLVDQRERARNEKDWSEADRLRDRLAEMGWQIQDTADGPVVETIPQEQS